MHLITLQSSCQPSLFPNIILPPNHHLSKRKGPISMLCGPSCVIQLLYLLFLETTYGFLPSSIQILRFSSCVQFSCPPQFRIVSPIFLLVFLNHQFLILFPFFLLLFLFCSGFRHYNVLQQNRLHRHYHFCRFCKVIRKALHQINDYTGSHGLFLVLHCLNFFSKA